MVNKKDNLSILRSKKTGYPKDPSDAKLETFRNPSKNSYDIEFETSEFTSLCPITGQPDFADIIIRYVPDNKCIESKSLKLYLFSYRNYGGFGETIINNILDDIVKAIEPLEAEVTGIFSPRGGISMKVEAEYVKNKRKVKK